MIEDVLLVIAGCLRGEEWAWNSFVKEFSSMAENILKRFSDLTLSDQENIIQNVFIKLLKGGLHNFQGTTKYEFLKYFKTTVINEGISYLKSGLKNRESVSLNGEDSEGLSLKDIISDLHPASRPDLNIEERQTLDSIRKIVEGFPLMDQQIFWMKIKGNKEIEIKKILKVPLGTVASKFSRMRDKIKKELGER